MSGVKVVSITAGMATTAPTAVATTSLGILAPTAGVVLATGAVLVGGAIMAKVAFDAYQNRQRQEQERAKQREQEIEERITKIRSGIQNRTKTLNLSTLPTVPLQPVKPNNYRKIQEQKERLPKIRSDYQILIDQKLLDESTVNNFLSQVEQALNDNNLEIAQNYLRTLDDARIEASQELERRQIQYVQERFDILRSNLPQVVIHEFDTKIQQTQRNWQSLTNDDLQSLHQQISELDEQVARISIAAQNMVTAWNDVGYDAKLVGFDNGDALIETDTHEGAKTITRIEFSGQQIELKAPIDQSESSDQSEMSCASRTVQVLKLFEEQGYSLEWNSWNGEDVSEEWHNINQINEPSKAKQGNRSSTKSSQRLKQQES